MRGAGVSPASGVHLSVHPSVRLVSKCDACSLILSWVMTYLTVQRCPICSIVSLLCYLWSCFFPPLSDAKLGVKINFLSF